jgi:hypothetical protein
MTQLAVIRLALIGSYSTPIALQAFVVSHHITLRYTENDLLLNEIIHNHKYK